MSTKTKIIHTLSAEKISALIQNRSITTAKPSRPEASREIVSPHFVARRQPISAEVEREIERLELAIRQGSANA